MPERKSPRSRRSGKALSASRVRLHLGGNGHSAAAGQLAEETATVKPKRRSRRTPRPERAGPTPAATDANPELRQKLLDELGKLANRLRQLHPGYTPPPFSPQRLLELLEESTGKIPPESQLGLLGTLRTAIGEDLFDADTWKGLGYVLTSSLQFQTDVVMRRMVGDYETDEWGFDREFLEAVLPFAQFMYKTYWRVEMTGLENVPETGRALLVSNHSGQLPWDGAMVATGMMTHHPAQRLVRTLYATWFPTLPFFSDLLVKCGQVLATEDNGIRLLENDELVAVYPEGYKGVGKLFKDRYRLARFGRGGFVRMALKTRAPIIPVAVVGAEETYISLQKSKLMAKLTGFPYFPLSPTFPWAGLLGFVPLPTKWYIDIGEPIPTDHYKLNSENNLILVSQLTDQVRNLVQKMLLNRLAQRRSVFMG